MPAPGDLLQNRYRIVREIGRGGMGAVYEAKDTRLDCKVAVKELFSGDDGQRKAFEREAKLLAGLHHPVLPKVGDHFMENGRWYLVMQFIDGNDLSEMLKVRGEAFPVDHVLRWAEQLLGVLEYLHKRNILHRDIKPSNLKLTETGEVILLDFGLAKGRLSEWSRLAEGSVKGFTPGYAPPEQLYGTETTERTDLYALGATLYHLLTGVIPTDGFTRTKRVFSGKPDLLRPVNELNSKTPPSVAKALMQSLALDDEDRPASAAEMRKRMFGLILENTFINSIGMEFMLIPAGSFRMGSETGRDDEKPIHRVVISQPFYIGKYQVTQLQWKLLMESNPSYFKGDDLPVENISWELSQEFIHILNNNEYGYNYRLPSEAEWEYACRAGKFGEYTGKLDEVGWYYENSGDQYLSEMEWSFEIHQANNCRSHTVGQKKANQFELYDMNGNVWEWCLDWYDENYYQASPTVDPFGPKQGQYKVARGGGWDNHSYCCRSTYRWRELPNRKFNTFGIRLVCTF